MKENIMNQKDTLIAEYQALRKEILTRLQIHHYLVLTATLFWPIFIIFGILLSKNPEFHLFLLFIPLFFTALIFNYQGNQRTMEATARYIEEKIRPKAQEIIQNSAFEWEKYFAAQKRRWQFSSSYFLFPLILPPFIIPIILLFTADLTQLEKIIAYFDLILLLVIIFNFRYKLFRVK